MTILTRSRNLSIALLFVGLCASMSVAQAKRSPSTQPPPPRPAPTPTEFKPAAIAVDVTGSFAGQSYTNPALGFVLTLPESWQAQDREVQRLLAGYIDVPELGDGLDEFIVVPALGDRAGVLGAIELARSAGE